MIDLLSIQPLDISKIIKSVKKTRKLIIVENDWINCGISSEIISRLVESKSFEFEVKRLGYLFTPCPTTSKLEESFYPNPEKIAKLSYEMITKKKNWIPKKFKLNKLKNLKVLSNEKNLLYESIKSEWKKFHLKKKKTKK